jgi:hypothetical protein
VAVLANCVCVAVGRTFGSSYVPPLISRKSIFSALINSICLRPSWSPVGLWWSAELSFTPRMKEDGVTDLILRIISIRTWALFVGDPPYSSLRILDYENQYKFVSSHYGSLVI